MPTSTARGGRLHGCIGAIRAVILRAGLREVLEAGIGMTTYRLHYFPESGNSYKLALMLTLCGQSFEPIWTDFGGGVPRTSEWRGRANGRGALPVLEVDGERLTQTAPIL